MDWNELNCCRCLKGFREGDEDFKCSLQKSLSLASLDDGMVTAQEADSVGYSDPLEYCWKCPELEIVQQFPAIGRSEESR
jgi:hypothetical protein